MNDKVRELVSRALAYEPPFIPIDNQTCFGLQNPCLSRYSDETLSVHRSSSGNPSPQVRELVDNQDISMLQFRAPKSRQSVHCVHAHSQNGHSTSVSLPSDTNDLIKLQMHNMGTINGDHVQSKIQLQTTSTLIYHLNRLHKYSSVLSAYDLVRLMSTMDRVQFGQENPTTVQCLLSAIDGTSEPRVNIDEGSSGNLTSELHEIQRMVCICQMAIEITLSTTEKHGPQGWLTSGRFSRIMTVFDQACKTCFEPELPQQRRIELISSLISALGTILSWYKTFGLQNFLQDQIQHILIGFLAGTMHIDVCIDQVRIQSTQASIVEMIVMLNSDAEFDDLKRLLEQALEIFHSSNVELVKSCFGMLPTSVLCMKLLTEICENMLIPAAPSPDDIERLYDRISAIGHLMVEQLMVEYFNAAISKGENNQKAVWRTTIEDFASKLTDQEWPSAPILCCLCYSGLKISLSQQPRIHDSLVTQSLREVLLGLMMGGLTTPNFDESTVTAIEKLISAGHKKLLWLVCHKALVEHRGSSTRLVVNSSSTPKTGTVVSSVHDYQIILRATSAAHILEDALTCIGQIIGDGVKTSKTMKGAMTSLFVELARIDPTITLRYIDITWHASRSDSQSVRREVPKLLALMVDQGEDSREIVQILCHLAQDTYASVNKSARQTLHSLIDKRVEPDVEGEILASLIIADDPDVNRHFVQTARVKLKEAPTSRYEVNQSTDCSVIILTKIWQLLNKEEERRKLIVILKTANVDYLTNCICKICTMITTTECDQIRDDCLGTLAACVAAQPQLLRIDHLNSLVDCDFSCPYVLDIYAYELCHISPSDVLQNKLATRLWKMIQLRLDRPALSMAAACLALVFRQKPGMLANMISKLIANVDSALLNDAAADTSSLSTTLVVVAQIIRTVNYPAHLDWASHVTFAKRVPCEEYKLLARKAFELMQSASGASELRSSALVCISKLCTIDPEGIGSLLRAALNEVAEGTPSEKRILVDALTDLLDDSQRKLTLNDKKNLKEYVDHTVNSTAFNASKESELNSEMLILSETNARLENLKSYCLSDDQELSRKALKFLEKSLIHKTVMPAQVVPTLVALIAHSELWMSDKALDILSIVGPKLDSNSLIMEGINLAADFCQRNDSEVSSHNEPFLKIYELIKSIYNTPRQRTNFLSEMIKAMELSSSGVSDHLFSLINFLTIGLGNAPFSSSRELEAVHNSISRLLASTSWETYDDETNRNRAVDILLLWAQLLEHLKATYRWSVTKLDGPAKKVASDTRFEPQLPVSLEQKLELLEDHSDGSSESADEYLPRKRAKLS